MEALPLSKLEQEWAGPGTTLQAQNFCPTVEAEWGLQSSAFNLPGYSFCNRVGVMRDAEACPSWSETIALDWELGGNGIPSLGLQLKKVEIASD